MTILLKLAACTAVALLLACGGGGSDSPADPGPPAPQQSEISWGAGSLALARAGAASRDLGTSSAASPALKPAKFTVVLVAPALTVAPAGADCRISWKAQVDGQTRAQSSGDAAAAFATRPGEVVVFTVSASLQSSAAASCKWERLLLRYTQES